MLSPRIRAPRRVSRTGWAAGRCRRAATLALAAALGAVLGAASLPAQDRLVEDYRASSPEGRLLAFYSAAMVFSSLGTTDVPGRWSVGVEATWLPRLSEAQRRPGIDKPETTNLSPVLPRPRVALRVGRTVLEGSWIPPLRVGDAQANLGAFAVSHALPAGRGLVVAPRVSVVAGRVRGAITCNIDTATDGGHDLLTYYATICHGTDSDDWFDPRLLAGEVVISRAWREGRSHAWLTGGARADRSRFDIGVLRRDGTRDLDHPILRLRDLRPHLAAGARWSLHPRVSSAVEAFYAPGSLATLRAFVGVSGRGR